MWKLIGVASALALAGCSTMGEKTSAAPALVGPVWVLENLDGKGIVDSSRADATFTADGKVFGRASCNRYTGGYTKTAEGIEISFTPMAMTRMACPPALMEQEDRFARLMQGARKLSFTRDGALMIGEGGTSGLFRAETPPATPK